MTSQVGINALNTQDHSPCLDVFPLDLTTLAVLSRDVAVQLRCCRVGGLTFMWRWNQKRCCLTMNVERSLSDPVPLSKVLS